MHKQNKYDADFERFCDEFCNYIERNSGDHFVEPDELPELPYLYERSLKGESFDSLIQHLYSVYYGDEVEND